MVLLGVEKIRVALVDEANHAPHQGVGGDEIVGLAVGLVEVRGQGRAHRLEVSGAIAVEGRRRAGGGGLAIGFFDQIVPASVEQGGGVRRMNVVVQQQVVGLGDGFALCRGVLRGRRAQRSGGCSRDVRVEDAPAEQARRQCEQQNQRAKQIHLWRPVIPVHLEPKE